MTGAAGVLAVASAAVGALCAAADGALLALDPDRHGIDEPLGALLRRRDRAHRALTIGRLAAHLTTGAAAAAALRLGSLPRPLAALLGVFVALAVVLASESGPRAVGDALGAPLLRALAPVVRAIELTAAPVVALGARLDALFRQAAPLPYHDEDERGPGDTFGTTAGSGTAADEHGILHGVFSLGDTEIQEIMVPRINVVGIERSTPWSEVVDRVRSAEHARFPIYAETIDHITGILYAKDMLGPVVDDEPPPGGWATLVRSATFIPEGKTIDAQLRDFKASRTHIAIVVDEYGGTAGLVTIEDILEEIVGEIRDEHDREERPIEAEDGCRFWVAGRVTLDDLAEVLGHRFESEDVTTVGGLVFNVLGRVPRAGEELTLDGFRVVVERVVRRRIERVYLERLPELAERTA